MGSRYSQSFAGTHEENFRQIASRHRMLAEGYLPKHRRLGVARGCAGGGGIHQAYLLSLLA